MKNINYSSRAQDSNLHSPNSKSGWLPITTALVKNTKIQNNDSLKRDICDSGGIRTHETAMVIVLQTIRFDRLHTLPFFYVLFKFSLFFNFNKTFLFTAFLKTCKRVFYRFNPFSGI